MRKTLNLVDKKFGLLSVIKREGSDKRQSALWLCVCDCGEQKLLTSHALISGNTKSCGCISKYKDRDFAIKSHLYHRTMAGAKYRKIEFNLNFDLFVSLVIKQCFYCNSPASATFRKRKKSMESILYNGLDRIDNNLGYIEGNVVSCCKQCNSAKNDMTIQEFQDWIQRVHSHYIQPNEQMDYNI